MIFLERIIGMLGKRLDGFQGLKRNLGLYNPALLAFFSFVSPVYCFFYESVQSLLYFSRPVVRFCSSLAYSLGYKVYWIGLLSWRSQEFFGFLNLGIWEFLITISNPSSFHFLKHEVPSPPLNLGH